MAVIRTISLGTVLLIANTVIRTGIFFVKRMGQKLVFQVSLILLRNFIIQFKDVSFFKMRSGRPKMLNIKGGTNNFPLSQETNNFIYVDAN